MKPLIYIFLISLLLLSCGKKVTVKGRVYDVVTNEGVSGVEITIGRANQSIVLTGDGVGGDIIATTITNQDGYYTFDERIRKNRQYSLAFHPDKDKYINTQSKVFSLSQKNKTIDFPIVPKATLNRVTKNTNCIDINDKIEVYTCDDFDVIPCDLPLVLEGCADISSEGEVPSGNIYFHWIVTKNNITTHHYDTIYLEPFQDYTYEILY